MAKAKLARCQSETCKGEYRKHLLSQDDMEYVCEICGMRVPIELKIAGVVLARLTKDGAKLVPGKPPE